MHEGPLTCHTILLSLALILERPYFLSHMGRFRQLLDYASIDSFVLKMERQFGRFGAVAIVSIGLLVLAAIYVRPGILYTGHGVWYEKLATSPFDFSQPNAMAFRILTPLVSYLVGLRGSLFIITNLIFATVLIGVVFAYFRRVAPRPGDALVAAVVVASSTVVLVTIGQSGWCDILSYLAIFAMWQFRRNLWLFALFFAVAIFNHESVVFLVPWLIAVRLAGEEKKLGSIIATLLVVGVVVTGYLVFRNWMAAQREVGYTLSFYLQTLADDPFRFIQRALPFYWLGLFSVFKLLWVIPALACYRLWRDAKRGQAILIVLPVALASVQLVAAWDSTRLFTLGFMTMMLALSYLLTVDADSIRAWLPRLVALNLLVPPLYTAAAQIELLPSTPVTILRMLIEGRLRWL